MEAITALAFALSGRPGCGVAASLTGSTGSALRKIAAASSGDRDFGNRRAGQALPRIASAMKHRPSRRNACQARTVSSAADAGGVTHGKCERFHALTPALSALTGVGAPTDRSPVMRGEGWGAGFRASNSVR